MEEDATKYFELPDQANAITSSGIYINSDGTKYYNCDNHAGSQNALKSIRVWDIPTPYDLGSIDAVNDELTAMAYDATADTDDASDVEFNPDMSLMFITGKDEATVFVYLLTTPGDPSTAVKLTDWDLDTSPWVTFPSHIEFTNNGYRMFLGDLTDENIVEFNLNAPYKPSTAVYVATYDFSPDFSGGAPSLRTFKFRGGGTKLYVAGKDSSDPDANVLVYDLSQPYELSTRTQVLDEQWVTPAVTVGDMQFIESEELFIVSQLTGGDVYTMVEGTP